jgi:predicted TIM-barrel fold metal-dependent hydrolase
MPVVLDHLGRYGQGTPQEYEAVIALAKLPRVYMKFSGVGYSSRQPFPHRDVAPLIRRLADAFSPQRMIWGGLGMNDAAFRQQSTLFEEMFAFATAADRDLIRGRNAARLYGFAQ